MRVAIFTGSSDGADQRWHEAATQVTRYLVRQGAGIVYSERGMTPTISAPSSIAMSATAPIRPTDAPP